MKESKLKKIYRNTCLNEFELNEIKELKSDNKEMLNKLLEKISVIERNSNELVYANVFHDTIKHSKWLDIPLSLTVWAIGYNFAYILYRTLDEKRPKKILEVGLGQSTKIVNEYVKYFKDAKHDIVEHNKEWVEFFKSSISMSKNSKFHLLECYRREYNGCELNAYKDFKKEFNKQKFDLILIDAPIGNTEYARMDILDIIPDCLEKDFVIIIDDCQRIGEQRTIEMLEQKLRDKGIDFNHGYLNKGVTDAYICTSHSNGYLCSV